MIRRRKVGVKWIRRTVKARLYKIPFGYSFYFPPDQGLDGLENAKWLIVNVGDYFFPGKHHRKGRGWLVTVPRWARGWLEELITDGKLEPKKDVKITIFIVP